MTTANDIITYLRTHLSDLSPDEMAMVRPYLAEYGEGESDVLARLFDGLCKHLESEMIGLGFGWPWHCNDRVTVPADGGRGSVTYTMRYQRADGHPYMSLIAKISHPDETHDERRILLDITPLHVMQGGEPYLWFVEDTETGRVWTHEVCTTSELTTKMLLLLTATRAAESGAAYAEPEIEEGPEDDPDDVPF